MITKSVIHALFEKFVTIYGKKFTHDFDGKPERLAMWAENWFDGLLGLPSESLKDALQYTIQNLDWPPSISEFRRACERNIGLPEETDILDCCIRRDFHHPIIKQIFDRIGSFDFQHATSEKLEKLINAHYKEELAKYRLNLYKECKLKVGSNLKSIESRVNQKLKNVP